MFLNDSWIIRDTEITTCFICTRVGSVLSVRPPSWVVIWSLEDNTSRWNMLKFNIFQFHFLFYSILYYYFSLPTLNLTPTLVRDFFIVNSTHQYWPHFSYSFITNKFSSWEYMVTGSHVFSNRNTCTLFT